MAAARNRTTEIHFDIELTQSQKDAYALAHDPAVRYITLAWSRQSGKSWLMELLCIEWLLNHVPSRIGYVCRSYLLAKKVYKEIISFIPRRAYDGANGSDLTITAGKSSLQFFSAESGSSLRGNTFDYLICDEFAFYKFEQPDGTNLWHDILSPTIKVRGRKCIFVSTPLGDNLFKEFFDRGISGSCPKWVSLKRTIHDDGLVTPEQIEEIRATIPALSFRREYLVEFIEDGSSFFTGFGDVMDNGVYRDEGDVCVGVDFSSTGEDRTVVTKINGPGRVWQEVVSGSLDERYRRIASIISSAKGLRSVLMESNSIGAPMGNEVMKLLDARKRRLCEWFNTTNSTKDEAVSALAVAISDKRLRYSDRALYDELRAFRVSWTKTGRPQYGGAGEHDDRVMSLAIAYRAFRKAKPRVTYATVAAKDTLIN